NRAAVQRPRSADVDRLPRDPLWQLPDVLPLPSGRARLRAHRRAPAHRREPCRRGGAGRSAAARDRRSSQSGRRGRRPMSIAADVTIKHAAPEPGGTIGRGGLIIIAMPLVLTAICFANYFGLITIPPGPRVVIIFVLLISIMTTGMPISIALGLTVLIFFCTMTTVPIDAVALKLFTGIAKFEIMAIPFFILAGNFLTHGGVARRMINFAVTLIGHFHGGLALAGVVACAMFALV